MSRPDMSQRLGLALDEVAIEVESAEAAHGINYASYHEAYGVLAEEVDEFFDEVRLKREDRSLDRIAREATQIAAVAVRIAMMARGGRR